MIKALLILAVLAQEKTSAFAEATPFAEVATEAESADKTGFYIEYEALVLEEKTDVQMNGFLWHDFGNEWGAFAWLMVGEEYAQAYAGPTLKLNDWLQVGAGLGVETSEEPMRFGSFVSATKGDCSLLGVYEQSQADYWYKAELNYKVNETWGAGAMVQRFAGMGPRVEMNVLEAPVTLSAAYLYEWESEDWNWLIGLRISF